jgi:N-acetylglutamate synthase-like GNAT family acetyltransferase
VKIERTRNYDTVREMNRMFFPEAPLEDIEGSDWWLVRNDAKQVVAYAGLYVALKEEAWLSRVGVLPVARGGGLQSRLIRAREARARKLGYGKVFTYTDPGNHRSNKNLAANGYVPYKVDEDGWLYWWHELEAKR